MSGTLYPRRGLILYGTNWCSNGPVRRRALIRAIIRVSHAPRWVWVMECRIDGWREGDK